MIRRAVFFVIGAALAAGLVTAQVPSDRIAKASAEPGNWLTYSGNYNGNRYSTLTQITTDNVKNLELQWVLQVQQRGNSDKWEASPLVIDGVLYTVRPPNDVVAVDITAKRVKWRFEDPDRQFPFYSSAAIANGLAILGGRDKMVRALEMTTGKQRWSFTTRARVESSRAGMPTENNAVSASSWPREPLAWVCSRCLSRHSRASSSPTRTTSSAWSCGTRCSAHGDSGVCCRWRGSHSAPRSCTSSAEAFLSS